MLVVAIEIVSDGPLDARTAAMARAMIDACSATVREGTCVSASDAPAEPPIAVATVTWTNSSERDADVTVLARTDDGAVRRARALRFDPTDVRMERWRTVGLTIATLVGDALPARGNGAADAKPGNEASPASATQASPVVASKGSEGARASGTTDSGDRTPHGAPGAPLPRSWVGLSAITGPGLGVGAFRFGAAVDAGFRPSPLPLFARLGFSYAIRGSDGGGLSVQWETLTLGIGANVGWDGFWLEPRLGVGVENINASAEDGAQHGSGSQLGLSLHGGLDAVLRVSRFGLVGSFDALRAHAPTQILVEGTRAGVSPAGGWSIGLGARYFFE